MGDAARQVKWPSTKWVRETKVKMGTERWNGDRTPVNVAGWKMDSWMKMYWTVFPYFKGTYHCHVSCLVYGRVSLEFLKRFGWFQVMMFRTDWSWIQRASIMMLFLMFLYRLPVLISPVQLFSLENLIAARQKLVDLDGFGRQTGFRFSKTNSEVVLVPLAKMSPLSWSHWQTVVLRLYSKVWQGTLSISVLVASLKLRAQITRDIF